MDSFTTLSFQTCKTITNHYSSSFSTGIRLFDPEIRPAIYAIYAFARLADEIVDTLFSIDQSAALAHYRDDTWDAISAGYSSNPVLHAFQWAYHRYGLQKDWVESFLKAMETDLLKKDFTQDEYCEYIHGSAEVIGLMCLKVFCENTTHLFLETESAAKSLGSAFQKVNFLRDFASDQGLRGRAYFPQMKEGKLSEIDKERIIDDIKNDFAQGEKGIPLLPPSVRRGVCLAYRYYHHLLTILEKTPVGELEQRRLRVSNTKKVTLYLSTR